MGTSFGSSKIQLASWLLISASLSLAGFVTTAMSSEPSPLKSPAKNEFLLAEIIVAVLSKTRATASLTSSSLVGAGLGLASAGVAVGPANEIVNGVGLLLTVIG